MEHDEFVRAWREGRVRVAIDREAAARFVSARLLLPFVAIAVIGAGIALALIGHVWVGLAVGAAGILAPRAIKRGAGGFVLNQIGADAAFYADALRAGALSIVETAPDADR